MQLVAILFFFHFLVVLSIKIKQKNLFSLYFLLAVYNAWSRFAN